MTDQPREMTSSSEPERGSFYRSDIDGLRAIAVLPVMLFHAGLFFPGGFVGVDVFFVISGYLITKIIEGELASHRFSVLVFYQRRIRRIFPALFVMFATSTLIALRVLPPMELERFGKSLFASSCFYSNLLFYRWSGYFAPGAEFTPLLHTWTLSVEEQYYMCWPILLWLLSAPAAFKWRVPALLSLFLGGLALSAHWVNTAPNAAFYLLPSRAWELSLGALISFPEVSRMLARLPRVAASAFSIIGIIMLAFAIFGYDKTTPFPGVAALLPSIGAGVIIVAGEGGPSIGGRLLSIRPLVWTGLISYSLYLWHWPILVFSALILNRKPSILERGGMIALTFLVAWASWKFIESPFRSGRIDKSRSRLWVMGGLASSSIFCVVGLCFFLSSGMPWRGPNVDGFLKQVNAEYQSFQASDCLARGASLPSIQGCLLGAPTLEFQYGLVLWGDSYAAQLAPALNEVGRRLGVTIRETAKAGCGPILGVRFLPVAEMWLECPQFNDAALHAILTNPKARVVILAARWDSYLDGTFSLTTDGRRHSARESRELFIRKMRELLTVLVDSGRQVILVGNVPLPPSDLIDCITRATFRGLDAKRCAMNSSRSSLETAFSDRPLAETESLVNQALSDMVSPIQSGIQITYPYERLCPGGVCMIFSGSQLLYMDNSHLSNFGARLLETDLEKSLKIALLAVDGD